MALDPRLASVELLTLAAMRARQHQISTPPRLITLQVLYYDALGIEPDELGERYTYEVPPHASGGGA